MLRISHLTFKGMRSLFHNIMANWKYVAS